MLKAFTYQNLRKRGGTTCTPPPPRAWSDKNTLWQIGFNYMNKWTVSLCAISIWILDNLFLIYDSILFSRVAIISFWLRHCKYYILWVLLDLLSFKTNICFVKIMRLMYCQKHWFLTFVSFFREDLCAYDPCNMWYLRYMIVYGWYLQETGK